MAIVKKDGFGVYMIEEFWWFKHYGKDCEPKGPYETRERAMEDLLECLGFDVATANSSQDGGSL